jgi:hypothetical protein
VMPINSMSASPFCNMWRILLPTSKILVISLLCRRSYRSCLAARKSTPIYVVWEGCIRVQPNKP